MLAYPTVEFRCLAVCDVEIKAREVKHKDDTADCSELVRGMVPALLLCRVNPWLPPRTGSLSHVRTLLSYERMPWLAPAPLIHHRLRMPSLAAPGMLHTLCCAVALASPHVLACLLE